MNILINDFNLVIADDYLREYAAFDAHKNKDELFDLIDRITRNRKSSFSSKNLTALSLAFFYTIHERWAFEKFRLFPKFGRVRVFEGYQRVFERAQETLTFW